MPVWHEKLQPWIQSGELAVVGVVQEQHPNRARLFKQWQRFNWPILHDPINSLGLRGVPVLVAIDEHGIVRSVGPNIETFQRDFLDRQFSADGADNAERSAPSAPDLAALQREAQLADTLEAWRQYGDALALWGGTDRVDQAIDAYHRALDVRADDGDALFRLGVCYRTRYESTHRKGADFLAAVDYWTRARAVDPNHYIWRRRIEQYGPRLTKPYPFYDWVETARREIAARGETPVELPVLPSGAEIASPSRDFIDDPTDPVPPDPDGRILRDEERLIEVEVVVVPPRIAPGASTRAHLTLRPAAGGSVHWNNEAQPLQLWIDAPVGWRVERRLLFGPQPDRAETTEPRHLEFELRAPPEAQGPVKISVYALYYICEESGGTCQFLRQDVPVTIRVGK